MCGVYGVYGVPNAGLILRHMAHGGQNRGQEACGLMTYDNGQSYSLLRKGRVSDLSGKRLKELRGSIGIAHVRYATAEGSGDKRNIQPLIYEVDGDPVGIVHNGNFTNRKALIQNELTGTRMDSKSDTEPFLSLILKAHRTMDLPDSIAYALSKMDGVFSGMLLINGKLVAIRDSWGTRPLSWGKKDGGYYVASENASLDDVGVFESEEIPAGTVMIFDKNGVETFTLPGTERKYCPFEWIYFASPASKVYGVEVSEMRLALGRQLAREHPIDADVVVSIPDSANLVAMGYALESGIPFDSTVMFRKHNTGMGRTFIMPGAEKRGKAVAEKSWMRSSGVRGKRIIAVDDSIVRGTTSRAITNQFWDRGAAEVHMLSGSPMKIGACRSGINEKKGELIAVGRTLEEIKSEIGVTSVSYLSLAGLQQVISEVSGLPSEDFCLACWDGNFFHP